MPLPPTSECNSSDAETVLGEDSPLSPCLWTQPAAVQEPETRQSTTQQTTASSSASQSSAPLPEPYYTPRTPRRELLLSPASQLNVLSQISELADAQSRQSAPAPTRPTQRRAHVWAPASSAVKGNKRNSRSTAASTTPKPKAKRQKKAPKQPTRSQAERLAADMLDWDTCSEGDLFVDGELDDWSYEDISDSDFDG